MRLLHTSRFELREFFDADIPEYAILSHTWSEPEVSLQDYKSHDKYLPQVGSGYKKIFDCCKLARSHNLDWAWVDTCCIVSHINAQKPSQSLGNTFKAVMRSLRDFFGR